MNIVHLKYAVEVEKTRSITQAAENLFMAQPNLSRAIKELEASLGISIFERTSKGMAPTPEGETLLLHAEDLLRRVDEVETMFRDGKGTRVTFSLSAPYSIYVSQAFAEYCKKMDVTRKCEVSYQETNASDTVASVFRGDYKLGIVRYAQRYEKIFQKTFEEKGLQYEEIVNFCEQVLISKQHPLATKSSLSSADLTANIEVCLDNLHVPSMPIGDVKREMLSDEIERRIFVNDQMRCLSLLHALNDSFSWSEPLSQESLDRLGLVQKTCDEHQEMYKDVLIYRRDYKLSKQDKDFITELCNVKRRCFRSM